MNKNVIIIGTLRDGTRMNKIRKRFVVLREFREVYEDDIFGFEVFDFDTKEIKYFTYYNKEDIYTPNLLHEFDPTDKKNVDFLEDHFVLGGFRRTNIDLLPTELVEAVEKSKKLHRDFNIKNNLGVERIDFNEPYLAVNYVADLQETIHQELYTICRAVYNSSNNSIGFYVNKLGWEKNTQEIREFIASRALHEVGHMEATFKELDEKNRILNCCTGFSHNEIKLKGIPTEDGNIVYDLDEIIVKKDYAVSNALEEIANEYRCIQITDGNYKCTYPNIGEDLNNLFRGNLLNFRYNATINDIVAYLKEIVPSEDLAIEFLNSIAEAVYSSFEEEQGREKKGKILGLMSFYEASLQK